jgi:hypothetical protein
MESTGRRGRRPRRCVGLRLTGFQLFEVVDGLIRAEALKDDDVEDDEGAGVDDKEKQKLAEEKMDVEDETKRKPKDVQPTGRVVGVIKRNWRA